MSENRILESIAKESVEHDRLIRFPHFRPRSPWVNGDLQTLRNTLLRPAIDLSPWPGHRIWVEMSDGSGDRLAAMLHWPEPETKPAKPLVVLVHGLTGCEDSFYIRRSAREALRRGHPVLRVNLRGAGPSRRKSRYQYHAGRSEDLHDLLNGVAQREPALAERGAVLVGYSLGGNLVIKYLAEGWERPMEVWAAVSISAPIDLKATQNRIMQPRNRAYHAYLLNRMKAESLAAPADLSKDERRAVRRAQSVYEFDDRFVAPRNGFEDAEDYYRRCSGQEKLTRVATPLLVIAAEDDPWIPTAAYREVDWDANAHLTPLIAPGGGHVGFHGSGSDIPWHDRCIARYLDHLDI